MVPPPLASMIGANARVTPSTPNTLVLKMSRPPSSARALSADVADPIPALLISSVTSRHAPAAAAMSVEEVTSMRTGVTSVLSIRSGVLAAA